MNKTIEPVSPFLLSANSSGDFCQMYEGNVRAKEGMNPVLSVTKDL